MAILRKGSKIPLAGGEIQVLQKYGEGGQGTVYKAGYSGQEYALKWYKHLYLRDLDARHQDGKKYLRGNIERNITKGSPSGKFLWPIAITDELDGCFGYIMKIRPQGYHDFADIINTKGKDGSPVAFKNFRSMLESALAIVNAFGALHKKGYFYLDLNDGNFFINTETGDVLICDNDNVTADPKYNLGKPGYIAPELVRGDKGAKPNALTDAHSLAVVLFKLFIRHDPLMGKNYCASVGISAEREAELYGAKPVFIFDPEDSSNRPVLNVHPNPINLWPKYPKYIQDAFIRAFCDGMADPAKRLVEGEWGRLLLRLSDDVLTCLCGQDTLWDGTGETVACPACGKSYPTPCYININNYQINLFPGKAVYSTHINDDFSSREPYGIAVASKQDPNKWGLKNVSRDAWNIKKPDGETITVEPGKVASVVPGTEFEFPGIERLTILKR